MESSLIRVAGRPLAAPTLVCFLLSTFDRGLSIVDADEPEASEGVRMLAGTSSFGNRDVEICGEGFELAILGCCGNIGVDRLVFLGRELTPCAGAC
jgi:hypothetical protein